MYLIPEFVEGRLVRYVINTDDTLGHALDLRKDTGHFTGTMTPIVSYGTRHACAASSLAGDVRHRAGQAGRLSATSSPRTSRSCATSGCAPSTSRSAIASSPSATRPTRASTWTSARDPVTDFALYENVDLVGVDPNNMGLFGYDNSPGKDNGNLRLYDQLGGVNATTQEDGYPGYGGVFVRSLMGFSKHPGAFAKAVPGADDSVRPDLRSVPRGSGRRSPVIANDLGGTIPVLTDGSTCPGTDRSTQIACAMFVMGNLIGGTLAHEIGHSLGLANPYADGFHDAGDAPNRLMDAGGDRPFLERAELQRAGPRRVLRRRVHVLAPGAADERSADRRSRARLLLVSSIVLALDQPWTSG